MAEGYPYATKAVGECAVKKDVHFKAWQGTISSLLPCSVISIRMWPWKGLRCHQLLKCLARMALQVGDGVRSSAGDAFRGLHSLLCRHRHETHVYDLAGVMGVPTACQRSAYLLLLL